MTTSDALLAAVLASTDDDLPRLVYADWLDENGQAERAEFIRAQIELAKYPHDERSRHFPVCLGPRMPDCSWCELRFRELQLIGDSVSDQPNTVHPQYYKWIGDIPSHMVPVRGFGMGADSLPHEQCIRRGFISEVRCSLADWCGGVCPTCDGWAFDTLHDERTGRTDHVACQRCNQTGRITAIGPAVVRAHPVERVVLTDCRPMQRQGGWSMAPMYTPVRMRFDIELSRDTFVTEEDAIRHTSDLFIAWAKSQPHPARIVTSPVSVDFVTG